MPKTKKAGLLTKLVILALLIYLATSLLNLQSRIRQTQAERDALSRQVAEQTQVNAARDKRGLVVPGEKVIVITN